MTEKIFHLDKVLLELGCFETSSRRTRAQTLKDICRLALEPRDPTARIVDATEGCQHLDDGTYSIEAALNEQKTCETLILHNFTTTNPSRGDKNDTRKPFSIALKQLCLSKCNIDESTIIRLSKTNIQVLVIWDCNVQGLAALTSLQSLVIVDCYIPKYAIETVLQNSESSLERVVLVRSGDISNQRKESSYYLSSNHYHSNYECQHHQQLQGQVRALQSAQPTLGQALLQSRIQEFALECSILPSPDLAYAIMSHLYLTKLSLSQTLITDAFAFWLAEALWKNQTIQELNLKQVCWSPVGAMAIAGAIRQSKSLIRLDLSETMWHGPMAKAALQGMLQDNCSLLEVQLNRLKDGEENSTLLRFVFQGLQRNRILTYIGLAGNYHHKEAEPYLFDILSSHPSLERLDLSKSRSLHTDALLGLSTNSKLRDISLEDCNIGRSGATAIGKILSSNTTLQSLDLCHNGIDLVGCRALVQGLKGNQSLERIFLYGNRDLAETESSIMIRNVLRDYNLSLRVIFLPCSDYQEEFQYYGSINFAGRKYVGDLSINQSLWPTILERTSQSPDMIMYLLQQKPDLFEQKRNHQHTIAFAGKKRSFREFLSH